MNIYDVHFGDETLSPGGAVHPFGAGHRTIIVVFRGPKWCKLLGLEDGESAEMHTDVFERMKPTELLPIANQELANRLKRHAEEYGRNNAIYREAMAELGYPVAAPERTEEQKAAGAERVKKMKVAKEAKVVVQGTGEVPGQNEGSGLFIRRLWMTGKYTPERIVELVLVSYPGRTTKKSDVYWNYKKLIELGTENVPAWPEKPEKKAKAIKLEPAAKAAPKEEPKPEPYDVKAMANATDLGRKQSRGKKPKAKKAKKEKGK